MEEVDHPVHRVTQEGQDAEVHDVAQAPDLVVQVMQHQVILGAGEDGEVQHLLAAGHGALGGELKVRDADTELKAVLALTVLQVVGGGGVVAGGGGAVARHHDGGVVLVHHTGPLQRVLAHLDDVAVILAEEVGEVAVRVLGEVVVLHGHEVGEAAPLGG